jgi:hypothetical protein
MNPARLLRYGAAAAGAGVLGFGAWSALAWARYVHVDPGRHPRDELLDRFVPNPEVDEYHQVEVGASAAVIWQLCKPGAGWLRGPAQSGATSVKALQSC